ncbi:hypothetical protein IFM51744_10755 [Aspergillus udagawae]|nr:hypothetical protein IFM51744_10755 [Aspergillus udagawae]
MPSHITEPSPTLHPILIAINWDIERMAPLFGYVSHPTSTGVRSSSPRWLPSRTPLPRPRHRPRTIAPAVRERSFIYAVKLACTRRDWLRRSVARGARRPPGAAPSRKLEASGCLDNRIELLEVGFLLGHWRGTWSPPGGGILERKCTSAIATSPARAGVKRSESYQRVMKYDFAGTSCLVRFEADGYLPSVAQNCSSRSSEGDPAEAAEDLLSSLDKVAISNLPESGLKDPESLKMQREKDEDTLGQELPRLWVAQVPYFILAHHKAGYITSEDTAIIRTPEAGSRNPHEIWPPHVCEITAYANADDANADIQASRFANSVTPKHDGVLVLPTKVVAMDLSEEYPNSSNTQSLHSKRRYRGSGPIFDDFLR